MNMRSRGYNELVNFLLLTVILSVSAIFCGCGSSGGDGTNLNGYTFYSDSDTLTNRYFPGSAGDVINFSGNGSLAGSTYTWTFTEGETIQGVATLHEKGVITYQSGDTSTVFDSMLAQDSEGNIHVLKNIEDGVGTLSGVAAGSSATLLMPGDPKEDDQFGPSVNYIGTVIALDEVVDSYTNVLHTQFLVDQPNNKTNQYDDYWAQGVGQIKSSWSLADGTTGYWLRVFL